MTTRASRVEHAYEELVEATEALLAAERRHAEAAATLSALRAEWVPTDEELQIEPDEAWDSEED